MADERHNHKRANKPFMLLDCLRWAFKGKSKLDQREMKNKRTSSPIWAGYSREMIVWLFQRLLFWLLNTNISPNEKPCKINAWIWILLWQLFNLLLAYHVYFPFSGNGMRPKFGSVSAAGPGTGTAGKGKIRKASLTDSWPGCSGEWAAGGTEAAAQLYNVIGKKNIQHWK